MAVRRLSRLPPSSLVKRGSNTKLLVHASVSSLATEPFASPTPPPWDVVIIREKDNPEGKDQLGRDTDRQNVRITDGDHKQETQQSSPARTHDFKCQST